MKTGTCETFPQFQFHASDVPMFQICFSSINFSRLRSIVGHTLSNASECPWDWVVMLQVQTAVCSDLQVVLRPTADCRRSAASAAREQRVGLGREMGELPLNCVESIIMAVIFVLDTTWLLTSGQNTCKSRTNLIENASEVSTKFT